jgi:hydrogenase nickel incorporation protein HypA/HybF
MSILDIAEEYAGKTKYQAIEEIELDIGCLTTIEMNAFEFAWKEGVRNTRLQDAEKKINRIKGKAKCMDCENTFAIENLFDPCPICGQHLLDILEGKELRVKSLMMS